MTVNGCVTLVTEFAYSLPVTDYDRPSSTFDSAESYRVGRREFFDGSDRGAETRFGPARSM